MSTRIKFGFALALFALAPLALSAESVVWNSGNIPEIQGAGRYSWYRLFNTNVSVTYEAGAYEVDGNNAVIAPLACGSSVPKGTRVGFIFRPHAYDDISWFTTGYGYDSPYGEWGVQHTPCGSNPQYVFYTQRGNMVSNYLSITSPDKVVEGAPGTCSQSGSNTYCNLDSEGTFTARMVFRPTTGRFSGYEHYRGCRPTNPDYTLQVPEQSLSCSIIVKPDNAAPTPPVVTPGDVNVTGGKCVVGSPYTISMTSTDPGGHAIRYGIDWNGNGTLDEFVPAAGYVQSGTTLSASRTFAVEGAKTVRVLAQNEDGFSSGWTTVNFTCSEFEGVESEGEGGGFTTSNDGGGDSPSTELSIRALPSLVQQGDRTRIHWSAANMDSCRVVGANGDTWDTMLSELGGNLSSEITESTRYELTCTDTQGQQHSADAIVNIVPIFSEQ